MLLGLQGERVHIDAGVRDARVVHEGLVLVEVLAELLLEAILAVEDNLELIEWADLVRADGKTSRAVDGRGVALLDPGVSVGLALTGGGGRKVGGAETRAETRSATEPRPDSNDIAVEVQVGHARQMRQEKVIRLDIDGSIHRHLYVRSTSREIPQSIQIGRGRSVGVGVAPDELLHWMVERQTDQLEVVITAGARVAASVLDLLNQVLVTLLGEATALLRIQIHVVGPDLEVGAEIRGIVRSQVKIQADLVVLKSNQGQVQTWVAVEEEQKRQVHARLIAVVVATHDTDRLRCRRGHLAPSVLVRLVEEDLGVQTPPGLVVLVDALAADGHLNVSQGALSDPAGVEHVVVGGGVGGNREQAHVHVTHQVTVTGDGHGHATGVGRGTVDRLLDVLHCEVGVALVDRLEESHLGLTSQVHILGTISYELHKSSRHFDIRQEKKWHRYHAWEKNI